jgi:hypothetical protein
LRTIQVGENIVSVGQFAISGTTGLESILFHPQNKVTSIGRKGLGNNVDLSQLILPIGLLHIPEEMCAGCESLPTLLVPDNVLTIGYRAFYQCFAFTNFILPKRVTTIVDNAFESCHELQNANLAPVDSVLTVVGDTVFQDCKSLETIQFPESLITIGTNTFDGVTTLKMNRTLLASVLDQLDNEQVVSFYGDSDFYTVTSDQTLVAGTGMSIVDGVITGSFNGTLTITGTGVLSRALVETLVTATRELVVEVDKSFTSLDDGIFAGMTKLAGVRFPPESTVDTIAGRSFKDCSSLKDIVFPVGLTVLGDQSFQGCSSLASMTIPSGVTTVGNSAFEGAAALVSINLGPATTTLGDSVFKDCALLKEVVIPESVTSMGNNLFKNCSSLSNLVFPRAMVSIEGTEILVGATALRSLKMHKDLWTTAVQLSLVENFKGFAQLVEFYGNADVLNLLTTKGYQDILNYYSLSKNSYTVDWSTGGSDLVKNGSSGLIYNGSLLTTGVGTFDSVLTILGTRELTPSLVEAGIRVFKF